MATLGCMVANFWYLLSQRRLHSSIHSELLCTHLVSHFVFYVPKTKNGNNLQSCYSVIYVYGIFMHTKLNLQ